MSSDRQKQLLAFMAHIEQEIAEAERLPVGKVNDEILLRVATVQADLRESLRRVESLLRKEEQRDGLEKQ